MDLRLYFSVTSGFFFQSFDMLINTIMLIFSFFYFRLRVVYRNGLVCRKYKITCSTLVKAHKELHSAVEF